MTCPRCGSQKFYNNGLSQSGSQRYKCASCKKTWTVDPKPTGRPTIFGYPLSDAERQKRHQAKQRKKFKKDTSEP